MNEASGQKKAHPMYDLGPNSLIHRMASEGIQHAIQGLSGMVGVTLTAAEPSVSLVNLFEIPNTLGGAETEAVGVYLKMEGKVAGQFMLIFPMQKALELIDLLMDEPTGSTKSIEGIGKSALAEVGNLTGSYFLNAIATLTGLETMPDTPNVICDMVGTIMDVIIATAAEQVEQVIMIETIILQGGRDVQATFWYVPDSQVMELFRFKE
jgi:chemotaxis protein CheC